MNNNEKKKSGKALKIANAIIWVIMIAVIIFFGGYFSGLFMMLSGDSLNL